MTFRIAVLAALGVALALLGAPLQGAHGAGSCPPCCAAPAAAECENGAAPCVSLAAAACCDAAPIVPGSPAKRTLDAPGFQPLAAPPALAAATASRRVLPPGAAAELARRASPLRLSVVRLL